MKKNFLFVCIAFLSLQTYAQMDPIINYNTQMAENWAGEYIRIGPYKVKGSLFLFGESLKGNLTYAGGKQVSDANILYDLYNQRAGLDVKKDIFEADLPLQEFVVEVPEKYGQNNKLLFRNAAAYGDKIKGYFNVLDDGDKLVFLKLFKTKLLPDPTNTMDKETKLAEQYSEYYMYDKATLELRKVKLKEKDILKSMGDDKQVAAYLSKKKLDLSKEYNVIGLVNKYNNNFATIVGE